MSNLPPPQKNRHKDKPLKVVFLLSAVFGCGGRTRTCDLQVMSLASYQLLHSAMLFLNCGCKGKAFFCYMQIFAWLFDAKYLSIRIKCVFRCVWYSINCKYYYPKKSMFWKVRFRAETDIQRYMYIVLPEVLFCNGILVGRRLAAYCTAFSIPLASDGYLNATQRAAYCNPIRCLLKKRDGRVWHGWPLFPDVRMYDAGWQVVT